MTQTGVCVLRLLCMFTDTVALCVSPRFVAAETSSVPSERCVLSVVVPSVRACACFSACVQVQL